MINQHNIVLFFVYLLTFFPSICYAQFRVYRYDSRSPEEIRRLGGFLPRGGTRLYEVRGDISLYRHALGNSNTGGSANSDGYVSTAAAEQTAVNFGAQFSGNGYVYEIAAGTNFIQVSGSLGHFSPFPGEHEYAALGGIAYQQVLGWRRLEGGVLTGTRTTNGNYDSRTYNRQTPSNGEPSLAGFPVGHNAWSERPWLELTGCMWPRRFKAIKARQQPSQIASSPSAPTSILITVTVPEPSQTPGRPVLLECEPEHTNVQYARTFMSQNGYTV